MKRFLLPAGIALFLHSLFLSMDMGWMKKKPAQPMLPQPIALALTYRQPQVTSPRTEKKTEIIQREPIPSPKKIEKKTENIQRKPTPSPKKEKKEQPKPKPTRKKKKVVQTKIKTRPKNINPSTKTTKPRQVEPEKEIQAKLTPETVPPPESEVSLEQDPVIFERLPDLYMARDEQDKRVAALPDRGAAVSSPPIQTIKEAIPMYRKNPPPTYPRIARRRGYQGTVFLEVLVNEEGKVSDLRLFQSCGHHVLDKAALASVKYWMFEPGRKGDEKVEMWVKVPIRFQLK